MRDGALDQGSRTRASSQELVVESAERQRVADCGVGRAGSPSRPVAGWQPGFSTGGSETRPYQVPTESYAPSRVPCTSHYTHNGLRFSFNCNSIALDSSQAT